MNTCTLQAVESPEKAKPVKKPRTAEHEVDEAPPRLKDAERALKSQPNSSSHRKEWMSFKRWQKSKKRFPSKLLSAVQTEACTIVFVFVFLGTACGLSSQEGRKQLFKDYLDCEGDTEKVELRFLARVEDKQQSKIKWGFRPEKWMIDRHGERKAQKLIERKKSLGLTLICTSPY